MSSFLGFLPDKESNYKVRKVVGEIVPVFDDFGIPVRWVKPSTYHISLLYLGERFSFINRILLKRRISTLRLKKIKIRLGSVKVGISRNYKELVYLDLKEGGEELRDLLLDLRTRIKSKDTSMFVPHLTIGRISKDLSQEEYRNVAKDLSIVSKNLDIKDIQFTVDSIYLIKSKNGVYTFEMKLETLG